MDLEFVAISQEERKRKEKREKGKLVDDRHTEAVLRFQAGRNDAKGVFLMQSLGRRSYDGKVRLPMNPSSSLRRA